MRQKRSDAAGGAALARGGYARGRILAEAGGTVRIARALSVQPRCIIFDETTAGLDVVRRRQALDLVRSLQRERGFAALFVTHDLAVARYMADTLWVMKDGAIVDTLERPFSSQSIHHPYTALLMSEADLGVTAP